MDTPTEAMQPLPARGRDPAAWRESRRKRLEVAAVSALATGLVRLIGPTLRIEAHPPSDIERYRRHGGGAIYAMWHGPHFPALWAYRNMGHYCITSLSADGEILTRILENLGYRTVRGSSTRGGKKGLIQLARLVRQGDGAAIAVDGPKGPRYCVKPGVMTLAKLSGAPIVPVGGGLRRYRQFQSWDRYRLPLPFTLACTRGAEPIYVEPDDSDETIEAKRRLLEQRLRSIQIEADEHVGNCGGLDVPAEPGDRANNVPPSAPGQPSGGQ